MEDNIRNLVKNNRLLLLELERIVQAIRVQNYDRALRKSNRLIDYINTLLEMINVNNKFLKENDIVFNQKQLFHILEELLRAQDNKDYILLADLYEVRLLPLMYQFQETILLYYKTAFDPQIFLRNTEALAQNDSSLKKLINSGDFEGLINGYSIELSSAGDITLGVGEGERKRYLHSNINVWKEAAALAASWYQSSRNSYIIYGLGLGCHIQELLILNESLKIEVYESDLNIIKLACAYGEHIKIFTDTKIKLVYDPDFSRLASRIEDIEENTEFVIHYPSLQALPDSPIKEKLENYFIQYNAAKNQLPLLNGNFGRNIHNFDDPVDDLLETFQGKSLYIVAAGPSLDKNFLQLKEVGDQGIILATGTVFKKLMNVGIKPDYVLVTDPNPRVYKQIAGLEDCDVPMIYLSTAYHGFAANYKGKKYLVCQKDYPKAEDLAREKGLMLFQTGGSVSTTALDIGISFGCSRIIFLGLDLAYTDHYAHASDTSRRNVSQLQDMRQVEDIHGNLISTSRSLDIFRNWIENRIRDVKGIEFIDATEGGAKIKGMRIARLTDVLKK